MRNAVVVVSAEGLAEVDSYLAILVTELELIAIELSGGPEYERVIAQVGEVRRLQHRIDHARLSGVIQVMA